MTEGLMLEHHLKTRPCVYLALTLALVLAGCAAPGPQGSSQPGSAATAAVPDADTDLPSLTRKPSAESASGKTNSTTSGSGSRGGRVLPETSAHNTSTSGAASGAGPEVHSSGTILPSGWEPWILHPSKAKTLYRLERLEGGSGYVMRADADGSASGLVTEFRMDPSRRPYIEWRWRIDGLIPGADNTDRFAEDSPVRLVLAFDGDKSQLPMRDRMFFERARLFTGRDLPYATLMYIWENNKPVGTVIENPHTGRVRKIVVASGPAGIREWKAFRRNIIEDYKLAFGKPPGRLVGVAILTDTDNTKEKVTAWYGDIKLLRR